MVLHKISIKAIIVFCLISVSAYTYADHTPLHTAQGTGMATPLLGSGKWVVIQVTDINGNIRDVMVLKGNASRVGIGTQKPSSKLTVNGHIESKKGFKFPDGSIQTKAQNIGATGATGARGPTGATVASSTSAICASARDTGNGTCSCSNNEISKISSPCEITSDTGSCRASSVFEGGLLKHSGQCCVCN